MTAKLTSQIDDLGQYVEFLADYSKRVAYAEAGDFSGETASCGICLDGSAGEKGLSIGDQILIDGIPYTLKATYNHNIQLVIN